MVVQRFMSNTSLGITTSTTAEKKEQMDLYQQLDQKEILLKGYMQREVEKKRGKQSTLKEIVEKLKAELAQKETMLQNQPPPLPMDLPSRSSVEFDSTPLDLEGIQMTNLEDMPPITTKTLFPHTSMQDPRFANLEQELKTRYRKRWMRSWRNAWNGREQLILHSSCIVYLTPTESATDYHMPTLPYPLLQREVLFMKLRHLLECPPNELGGYKDVSIDAVAASSDYDQSAKVEGELANKAT